MRELRTLKRTRLGLRVRSVQGRLSIELGNEDEAGDSARPEPPARNSGFRRPVKSPSTVAGPVSVRDRKGAGADLPPPGLSQRGG